MKRKRKIEFQRLIYGRTLLTILLLLLQFYYLFSGMFWFVEKLPVLFGSTVVFTGVVLCWILNSKGNPSIKLSWCILVAIFPLLGAVLYLFFRFDWGHKALHRRVEAVKRDAAERMPDFDGMDQTLRRADPGFAAMAVYMQKQGFATYPGTGVKYLPLGENMLEEMLRQLERAEKYIFLEYFAIAPSYFWDSILKVLKRKAAQGVEVRLLYDGSCAVSYLPHDYPGKLQQMGIQCKVFSPFLPLVSSHYNNRDHRKMMIIDGKVAFTGGINILDRYINRKEVFGHWKDTGIMVEGAAAHGFTLLFLQMWNVDEKQPVYEPYLPSYQCPMEKGLVIPFGDAPSDDENVAEMVYLNMLNQAKRYVYIMTPYLILDNEMVTALTFAAKRGVDVRIVLPHIPDKKYAFVLAKSHYRELIDAGVRIWEYTPGFVHGKMFLCDDLQAVVGTVNLDYRSLYLHFECGAYLYQVDALSDIRQDFEQTMEISQEITAEAAGKQGFFSILAGKLLKIIAPLL